MYKKYSTNILDNNLRLDVFEKKNSPIHLRISILCGDALLKTELTGLAHFVEHILLAGTKKFDSKEKIALYLDQFGGDFGGATNPEKLYLNFKISGKEYIENLFIVLKEVLSEPLMTDKIIETERGAIISEYKSTFSKTIEKINKKFREQIFFNTPYTFPVLGTLENIAKIQKVDCVNFLKENLKGGKIGIIISGDVDIDAVLALTNKYLNFIPKSESARLDFKIIKPLEEEFSKNNQSGFIETSEDISHIKIGFRVPNIYHKFFYEYALINNILGSRRGSIFNKILRYENGLVYSINSGFSYNKDSGFWSVNTACKQEDILVVIRKILQVIKKDIYHLFSEERFALEKQRMLLVAKTAYETSSDWLEFGWNQTTTTEYRDFTFFLNSIEELSYENCKLALKEMFANKNLYITYSDKNNIDKEIERLISDI